MSALHVAIWQVMVNDSVLSSDLGFIVSDRWLTQSGPGATPDAFSKLGTLKRSLVVLDTAENQSPARRPGYDHVRLFSGPIVYAFAELHRNGQDAIEAAYRRVVVLLHGRELVLPSGERPLIEVKDGRSEIRQDESFEGNFRSEIRLTANWGRRLR